MKEEIVKFILAYANEFNFPPTEVKDLKGITGIAWNTSKYYVDAEIRNKNVDFTYSEDRKHIHVISITHIQDPYTSNDLFDALEKIRVIVNEK